MKIFNLPRGCGKTIRMLYASEFNDIPILVATETRKDNLLHRAKWNNINIPTPITVSQMTRGKDKSCRDILVDDIDCVFKQMLAQYGLNMISGTITIDNEVQKWTKEPKF